MNRVKTGCMAAFLGALACALPALANEHEKAAPQNIYLAVKSGEYKDYVLHTPSKKWLQRQVQIRVSQHRKMPRPLDDSRHGEYIHSTDFFPGGCGSGKLVPERYSVHEGHKVWQFTNTVDADDIKGLKALGITIDSVKGDGTVSEGPMEIFYYPPLKSVQPGQWTEWEKAGSQKHGDMVWWSEVHKMKPEEHVHVEHPFEMRWRLVLKEDPVRIMDDGIVDEDVEFAGNTTQEERIIEEVPR